MTSLSWDQRQQVQRLERSVLAQLQLEKLNRLLAELHTSNRFYQQKLAGCPAALERLEQLDELPITTKNELQPGPGGDPFAVHRTFAVEAYTRFHQTSGTHGRPLVVLDTPADWQWWLDGWQYVLDAAEITPSDRCLLAFSFGPFIGFWSAFDAVTARGALAIPGGGMSSLARLELAVQARATAVFCTPSYALHLAQLAAEHRIDLPRSSVRRIVVAGEPGGSVPAIRDRIERAWGARVVDHAGASEVGPWGFADVAGRGMHVNEAEFIAEFISVETGRSAVVGELSQLVLTALGRVGLPVIRYRTGDLVRPKWPADGPCKFVLLEGGVLGRADDMMIIRGVNVYPSAIEQILHGFPEVVEYRLIATKRGALDELVIEIEDRLNQPDRVAQELLLRLGLKVEVRAVPAMTLPRFEGKGRRFVDERNRQGEGEPRRQGDRKTRNES